MDDIIKEIRRNEKNRPILAILRKTEVFENDLAGKTSLKERLQSLMSREVVSLKIKNILEHGIVENEETKKIELYLEKAIKYRDNDYLEQIIGCLDYITFKNKEEQIFECYLSIFELFDAVFELKGNLKEVNEKIAELEFDLESTYAEAERLNSKEKKEKCLILSDSIEHWEAIKVTKSQLLEEYEKKIEELEVSIHLSDNPQVDIQSFKWIIN